MPPLSLRVWFLTVSSWHTRCNVLWVRVGTMVGGGRIYWLSGQVREPTHSWWPLCSFLRKAVWIRSWTERWRSERWWMCFGTTGIDMFANHWTAFFDVTDFA